MQCTYQKHFFVGDTTDDQLPVRARALPLGVVDARAHRDLESHRQIFPYDFVAWSSLARDQAGATGVHA